jgi:glycosyltransferase involved in cell wall biosynthesis
MWIAVVPAYNEANSIANVLRNLFACDCFHRLIIVANGCTDATEEVVLQVSTDTEEAKDLIELLSFPDPLGIDVPRAIGAAYAQKKYPSAGIIFADGDLAGQITIPVLQLIDGLARGLDLALTNCYPSMSGEHTMARRPSPPFLADTVLKYRQMLNERLSLSKKIGQATPSHGPHAISARLLAEMPLQLLAIPPVALAYAARHSFQIGVAATIPHELLGSKFRNDEHAANIAATIIADCKQALAYLDGTPFPELLASSAQSISGYQRFRRFDLLDRFLYSTGQKHDSRSV